MNKVFNFQKSAVIIATGTMLLTISACGHRDLKAPCSAAASEVFFSGSAFASCGPMRVVGSASAVKE